MSLPPPVALAVTRQKLQIGRRPPTWAVAFYTLKFLPSRFYTTNPIEAASGHPQLRPQAIQSKFITKLLVERPSLDATSPYLLAEPQLWSGLNHFNTNLT